MDILTQYLDKLRTLFKRKKAFFCAPAIVAPGRDWLVVLGVIGALAAAGFWYAALCYAAVSAEEEVAVLAESPRPVLDAARLSSALARTRLRAEEHAQLRLAPPILIDPSR